MGLTDAGLTVERDDGTSSDQPPTISSTPNPSFVEGTSSTYDFTANVSDDGLSAVTYSLTNTLPSGLTLNSSTGILDYDGIGVPTVSQHQLTATDAVGSAQSSSFDVAIAAVATGFTGDPLFVDSTLVSNITNGTYNHISRDGSGSDNYNAYTTVQGAVSAVVGSNNSIYIRGGTYNENVHLSAVGASSVPDGTASEWNCLRSYPGEWAIINGNNNQDYTIGEPQSGRGEGGDFAYWKFERLEITGGTSGGTPGAGAGLYISGGPFEVRYCYIHHNQTGDSNGTNNPGGIVGYAWFNSVI